MSERRRFFPARPVQRVPGQRVELEVQLRAEVPVVAMPAKASGCVCDVAGVTWFDPTGIGWTLPSYIGGGYSSPLIESHGVYVAPGPVGGPNYETWVGSPVDFDGGGAAAPIVSSTFFCTQVFIDRWEGETSLNVLIGGAVGAALCDVQWAFEWDHARDPSDPSIGRLGLGVRPVGNMFYVHPTGLDPIETLAEGLYLDTLTATARCGGDASPVGVLTLNFERYIWDM